MSYFVSGPEGHRKLKFDEVSLQICQKFSKENKAKNLRFECSAKYCSKEHVAGSHDNFFNLCFYTVMLSLQRQKGFALDPQGCIEFFFTTAR